MIDLYKLGIGVGFGNSIVIGEKSSKEEVFKGKPRDITGNVLHFLILNYNDGVTRYEFDMNENQYFEININVELKNRY